MLGLTISYGQAQSNNSVNTLITNLQATIKSTPLANGCLDQNKNHYKLK